MKDKNCLIDVEIKEVPCCGNCTHHKNHWCPVFGKRVLEWDLCIFDKYKTAHEWIRLPDDDLLGEAPDGLVSIELPEVYPDPDVSCYHSKFEFTRLDERSSGWACTRCGMEITCAECEELECESRGKVERCVRAWPPVWRRVKRPWDKETDRSYSVYLVEYKTNAGETRFYCGVTNNPPRRRAEHGTKRGARSLRGKTGLEMQVIRNGLRQDEAYAFEREVKKKWSHAQKAIRFALGMFVPPGGN